ncbi:MAG TPA: cytochrome P450 [Pyrinomonadaceae bacterium]|nr:cytochrome P450 [Pyrinomonadaceae bacterium]
MFDADFITNPYRAYSHLRAAAPLHWIDKFRNGAWLVTRYADVVAGLHDARLSSQRSHTLTAALPNEVQSEFETFNRIFSKWMLFLDPPEHSRIRKLLNKEFTPNMIQRLRPRIQHVVDSLLDDVAGKSEIEFMTEFANPLPVRVIAEMLGIPAEDQRDFQIWSDDLANFFGNATPTLEAARRAQNSLVSLTEYFRALLPERRAHKEDDLVSLLLRVEEEGEVLTGEELLAQCTLLLVAGHETTRNLLGNGLLALLQHPDQLAKLKQNPALINSTVRELARFDSPVQFSGRAATEDFTWHDHDIRRGQTVILLLGSANHDPEKFSDPEKLEISRDEGMPLSFGHGTHFCIGAALAYTEAEIAFTTLFERASGLKLLDHVPAWRSNLSFRGLSKLPISLSVQV